MVARLRHLVALLTAVFVVACQVYCACGGPAASATAPTVAANVADEPAPCHAHASGKDPSGREEPAAPGHGKHSSCQHCMPFQAAEGGMAKGTLDVNPAASPMPLYAALPVVDGFTAVAGRVVVVADLPPPVQPPTLLGLHCALNT